MTFEKACDLYDFVNMADGTVRIYRYKGLDDSIEIPSEIGEYKVSGIGYDYKLPDFTRLKSIKLPNSVRTIAEGTFKNCTELISINIPNSVKSIFRYTFAGCANLKDVTISDSVIKIDDAAFVNCIGLTNIVIPNSVKIIDKDAFCNCTSLECITLPYACRIGPNAIPKGTSVFFI